MKNNKGFSNYVLIIIILLLVGVLGYFALSRMMKPQYMPIVSQTSISVSETEYKFNYNGENYGFEFNYPKNLKVVKGQVSGNIDSFHITNPEGLGDVESIILWVVPNQTSLNDFTSSVYQKLDKLNFTISDDISISGIQAKRILITNNPLVAESSQTLFFKNGYGYRWFANRLRDADGGKNMIPALNNILFSFKFTK